MMRNDANQNIVKYAKIKCEMFPDDDDDDDEKLFLGLAAGARSQKSGTGKLFWAVGSITALDQPAVYVLLNQY